MTEVFLRTLRPETSFDGLREACKFELDVDLLLRGTDVSREAHYVPSKNYQANKRCKVHYLLLVFIDGYQQATRRIGQAGKKTVSTTGGGK